MTLTEAKSLSPGDRIYTKGTSYTYSRNPRTGAKILACRVTSVKTWKTRPNEIHVTAKWGLRTYYHLGERDIADWYLNADDVPGVVVR